MHDERTQNLAMHCFSRKRVGASSPGQESAKPRESSFPADAVAEESTQEPKTCCICLGHIQDGPASVTCHCCSNSMHFDCALRLQDVRCPTCRAVMFSQPPSGLRPTLPIEPPPALPAQVQLTPHPPPQVPALTPPMFVSGRENLPAGFPVRGFPDTEFLRRIP